MTNENPFIKTETSKDVEKKNTTLEVEVPKKSETSFENTGRKVIDETTLEDSNWINLPNKKQVGEFTPAMKILKNGYFNQEGRELINKKTGEKFYTGLESGKGDDYTRHGEFIIEGLVEGNKTQLRLSNWEVKIKMDALVRYCRDNNFTLANQEISFKRVNEGQENAGENWELLVGTLGIKIEGAENSIVELK